MPAWKKHLREATLFRLGGDIERGLVTRLSFSGFMSQVKASFEPAFPHVTAPRKQTLRRLYECAMWARTQLELWQAARRIKGTQEWRTHKKWLQDLIDQVGFLEALLGRGCRKFLPKNFLLTAQSTRSELGALQRELIASRRYDGMLEEYSKEGMRNAILRQARLRMNRILLEHSRHLKRGHRIELIRLTVEAAKLKKEESTEAVRRFLHRH